MFFSVGENAGDGELDLSGIDDSEIDRVKCHLIPSLCIWISENEKWFLSGLSPPLTASLL